MDKFFKYNSSEKNNDLGKFVPTQKDETYLPSEELQAAVNVAIALGQPLLITGEPGTGKTQLAFHIAKQFRLSEPLIFHAQTNSVKKDLFYHYDALRHFQYAQTPGRAELNEVEMETKEFIRYEALGQAIKIAKEQGKRSVVLIDEIDKAPRDLPNDLLFAIEKLEFAVTETPKKKEWKCPEDLPPIIIITSNLEKNLPDAFLRRVVFHHIKFPEDEQRLLEILQSKGSSIDKSLDLLPLVQYFLEIRNNRNLIKKPATAELIAWAMLLSKLKFNTTLLNDLSSMPEEDKKTLKITFSVLAKSREDLQKLEDHLG